MTHGPMDEIPIPENGYSQDLVHGFFPADERGQGLVEYGFLLGFVAVIVVALAALFGAEVTEIFVRLDGFFQGQFVG